jgi:hypothetical protein
MSRRRPKSFVVPLQIEHAPARSPKKHRAKLETYGTFDVREGSSSLLPVRFGWRFIVNGRHLAISSENYSRRRIAVRAFRAMAQHLAAGSYDVVSR